MVGERCPPLEARGAIAYDENGPYKLQQAESLGVSLIALPVCLVLKTTFGMEDTE